MQLEVKQDMVVAEVPASKVAELTKVIQELMEHNVIPVKTLRSLTGKVMSIGTHLCNNCTQRCMQLRPMHQKVVSGPNRFIIH